MQVCVGYSRVEVEWSLMKTLRNNASSDSQVYATEYFAMVKRVVESVRGEAGMRPDRTGKRQCVNVEGFNFF